MSTLSLDRAATVLIMLVLGGYGRLYGAFVGAVAYMVLSHYLAKIYPTAWQLGPRPDAGDHRAVRAQRHSRHIRHHRREIPPQAGIAMTSGRQALLEARSIGKSFGALVAVEQHQFPSRCRRAPRADRTERRRQDHLHQSADRRAGADRGQGLARRPGHDRRWRRPSASSAASRAPSRSTGCSAGCRCWKMSISRSPSSSAPRRTCSSRRACART